MFKQKHLQFRLFKEAFILANFNFLKTTPMQILWNPKMRPLKFLAGKLFTCGSYQKGHCMEVKPIKKY